MGYGAIISGLVNAGFDIYNQFSKGNPAAPFAQESSRINEAAKKYLTPFTSADFWKMDLPQMATTAANFGMRMAPGINQFNMGQLQSLLNQAFPGYQSMFNQASTNAQQLMSGAIPTDVQQNIQRAAAATGLTGGYGAPMTGSNAARNLGVTSLQLQQTGTSQFGNLMTMASNYMMPQPVNPLSILPLADLINTTEWSKTSQFQGGQAMFSAKAMAAAAQAGMPPGSGALTGVGGDISSILSALTKSPQGQSGGSGSILSMLGGLFGGSGGGGGGFGGLSSASSASSGMSIGSMLGMG